MVAFGGMRYVVRSVVMPAENISGVERAFFGAIVGVTVGVGVVSTFVADDESPAQSIFQVAITALFAIYLWAPVWGSLALIAAMGLSFAVDLPGPTLVALTLSVGVVARLAQWQLIALQVAAVAIAIPFVGSSGSIALDVRGAILAYGMITVVSLAVGLLLRASAMRHQLLKRELAASERAQQEATAAERQRIADELHDVVAHDLTVIVMHARLPASTSAEQDESRSAILEAARKALSDLRAVVSASRDIRPAAQPHILSLDDAMNETLRELEASGRRVDISGYRDDIALPRLVNSALARILREASTNILKHGGEGSVRIRVSLDRDAVGLEVRNPISVETGRRERAQPGYGTTRMAERTRHFGGDFHVGCDRDDWIVTVRLPLR